MFKIVDGGTVVVTPTVPSNLKSKVGQAISGGWQKLPAGNWSKLDNIEIK
jgi:hypothetical protein